MSTALFSSALLVEDEPNLAVALEIALKKLEISSRHATTLKSALSMFEESEPDFILLDRNLPDGDGLQLCSWVRSQGYTGTILMLTAAAETHNRVEGLNEGADDYLAKPFSWEELEARIRALSRRRQNQAPSATGAKPPAATTWQLEETRLRILGPKDKGWIELTPLEFKLASKLITAGGAIVTRDELLKDVWGFTLLPKTRTVDHFMGRLRKHFEEDPEKPKHFITVRGAGYRFEP